MEKGGIRMMQVREGIIAAIEAYNEGRPDHMHLHFGECKEDFVDPDAGEWKPYGAWNYRWDLMFVCGTIEECRIMIGRIEADEALQEQGWGEARKEEKKMTKLEEIRLAGDEQDEQAEAQAAGATWMEIILTESENPEEWLGMNYQEFLQAAADVTRPAFPAFETTEETDAAYHGAWGQLVISRDLFAQDAIYQEDLNRRKYPHSTEGWKEYDGR